MRILVISDTHIPIAATHLPAQVLDEAAKCDACIHAGDIVQYQVIEQLSKLCPVYAVAGNMDDIKIKKKLPSHQCVNLGGIKIIFPLD